MALIKAYYYQQFAEDDVSDPVAASFGGWQSEDIEISSQHTALVVMHVWDCRSARRQYPGWYRCNEQIDRMNRITDEVLGPLVQEARRAQLRIYHVVYPGNYYDHLPGYRRARTLCDVSPSVPQIKADPMLDALRKFRSDRVFVGAPNKADVEVAFERLDFAPQVRPLDSETIVDTSEQLFAACRHDGINHLVYTGFALNACMVIMPGGMEDMRRHGMLCSVIREATTAIENRETVVEERARDVAIWNVALTYGFVFGRDDVVTWLHSLAGTAA